MPTDEEEANCILGVCCEPDGPKQQKAMTAWLERKTMLSHHEAKGVAMALLLGWDFAPKGLLQPFKDYVAARAREFPYE